MTNKSNQSTIQIIAGRFKGTRLAMPTNSLTRPSKSILKESLFNTLTNDIWGSCFVEAFGGIGSIGLEALSRGAKKAIFFEQNKQAFSILTQNIKLIKAKDPNICIQSFCGDTFALLSPSLFTPQDRAIIYLDPPFDIRQNHTDIYERCFCLLTRLKIPWHLVVFEHSSAYKMPENISHLSIIRQKKFGKSTLSYYTPYQTIKENNA
ncbi:16S rRNA (guanine(966)-N(2))-methyltransferase RsmD [Helicobacter sp. 12S02634-8]|uniref:16S rRNA (guanine(966)-N(2))-methyltransferase RsmD n=1 Tax=Helicobacter sp. 12S02634-8 TaxID=1476199 RepID=UPI000BA77931|nr:16S rRNA (guanine(966)-N(2))-methyltransferase RsmD [Helicobacter sp. 12S02634-8]PAF47070.1 16S rRNA (guanine(966)-N(2))-methyltransferase RsmD [Helicobacter sp. 12S02634-8]